MSWFVKRIKQVWTKTLDLLVMLNCFTNLRKVNFIFVMSSSRHTVDITGREWVCRKYSLPNLPRPLIHFSILSHTMWHFYMITMESFIKIYEICLNKDFQIIKDLNLYFEISELKWLLRKIPACGIPFNIVKIL